MTIPRRLLHVSIERDLPEGDPDRPSRVRLTASLESPREGQEISTEELADAIRELRDELDAAVGGPVSTTRPDRPLGELVQTYRPRQMELVELLHEEGELTDGEHSTLRQYLASGAGNGPTGGVGPREAAVMVTAGSPAAGAPPSIPSPEHRPLAAAPLARESAPPVPRRVAELLAQYQIQNLKQAGAVRARRQISFEEYMALKRHFESAPPGDRSERPAQ